MTKVISLEFVPWISVELSANQTAKKSEWEGHKITVITTREDVGDYVPMNTTEILIDSFKTWIAEEIDLVDIEDHFGSRWINFKGNWRTSKTVKYRGGEIYFGVIFDLSKKTFYVDEKNFPVPEHLIIEEIGSKTRFGTLRSAQFVTKIYGPDDKELPLNVYERNRMSDEWGYYSPEILDLRSGDLIVATMSVESHVYTFTFRDRGADFKKLLLCILEFLNNTIRDDSLLKIWVGTEASLKDAGIKVSEQGMISFRRSEILGFLKVLGW